jgi:hypothetical protein
VGNRFLDVANWQPYGGPYGFDDYDSIEVGDGPANSGMSYAAEESQLSLWALGSAPLILGSDLTSRVTNAYGSSSGLNPRDFTLLTNRQVIEVDQDGVDAKLISCGPKACPTETWYGYTVITAIEPEMVYAKVEPSGDAIVGLFNTNQTTRSCTYSTCTFGASPPPVTISTNATAIGLPRDPLGYTVRNIWTGKTWTIPSSGVISAGVPYEGVALLRVTPITPWPHPFANLWSIPTLLLEEWSGIASRLSQFSL